MGRWGKKNKREKKRDTHPEPAAGPTPGEARYSGVIPAAHFTPLLTLIAYDTGPFMGDYLRLLLTLTVFFSYKLTLITYDNTDRYACDKLGN